MFNRSVEPLVRVTSDHQDDDDDDDDNDNDNNNNNNTGGTPG